jgi:D-alanyl-D-alanine carboxypeptidase
MRLQIRSKGRGHDHDFHRSQDMTTLTVSAMTFSDSTRTLRPRRAPIAATFVTSALVLAGCGGGSASSSTTTRSASTMPVATISTTSTTQPPSASTPASTVASEATTAPPSSGAPQAIDRAAAQQLLGQASATGKGGAQVALAGNDGELVLLAAGADGPDARPVTVDSEFRVGSITKTFVAVTVLQLAGEGAVQLDELATRYDPSLTIADGVTVRQLLSHRSGIPDYVNAEYFERLVADPTRTWNADDVFGLVAGLPRVFPAGSRFEYSNTNYIVLGQLVETITGKSIAENLRTRIIEPLGLQHTYLAPDDARTPIGGFSELLPGGSTATTSYYALETSAGSAGALVSNAGDLAVFIRALANGKLLAPAMYTEMTRGLPYEGEALGLFPADPATSTGISHSGSIPGFAANMQYDPASQDLVVLLMNHEAQPFDPTNAALTALASAN